MRRELRGGEYFGARPTPAKIRELIDDVVPLFDEAVEVEYLTIGPNYYVRTASLDDLIDELGPSVRSIKNLAITIKCTATEKAEVRLIFGESPGHWKLRLLLFPYRTRSVTYWTVEHPDASKATRLGREIRHGVERMRTTLWSYRSGISKRHTLTSIPFVLGACLIFSVPNPDVGDWEYYVAAGLVLLWRWFILAFDYTMRIEVRPPAIATWWSSWNPSEATVARSTVLATVFAVPALILGLVQVLQG
ncbi:hypothetical protein ACFYXW_27625 [Streptomyces sp. NPDC001981]|uniref:hypothetical protein n=1 Tax=Streptomyces sp. NPDC001981 TaxID=3364628 RepID=UPI0036963FC8